MNHYKKNRSGRCLLVSALLTILVSCGGGGGGGDNSIEDFLCILLFPFCIPNSNSQQNNVAAFSGGQFYIVGGTVSGLAGSGLVLENNGADGIAVGSDGAFVFLLPVSDRGTYAVDVKANPVGPSQTCAVSNNRGTIAGANPTNVLVTCSTNTYSIGGTVSGLFGTGLVLQNNGGDDLALAVNGEFAFAEAPVDGTVYSVLVKAQPPGQVCIVSNGTGTVTGRPVSDVLIDCSLERGATM